MPNPDWLPDYLTWFGCARDKKKETPRTNPDVIDAEFTVRDTIFLDSKD
jgi:hypothetical protein